MNFEQRTLVLDINYQPIKIIKWKKAISYIVAERAQVIDHYEDFIVRGINIAIKVPKILRVFGRKKLSIENKISLTNKNIFKRDNYFCTYCNKQFNTSELTLDHIIPKCQGGENTWENLITACSSCNTKKGGRTPEEANMKLHYKPYKPNWTPKDRLSVKNHEIKTWSNWIY